MYYTVNGRLKILARRIKAISDDIDVSGPIFPTLVNCVLKSLAQRQRIEMETAERVSRRTRGLVLTGDLNV